MRKSIVATLTLVCTLVVAKAEAPEEMTIHEIREIAERITEVATSEHFNNFFDDEYFINTQPKDNPSPPVIHRITRIYAVLPEDTRIEMLTGLGVKSGEDPRSLLSKADLVYCGIIGKSQNDVFSEIISSLDGLRKLAEADTSLTNDQLLVHLNKINDSISETKACQKAAAVIGPKLPQERQ